MLLELLERRYDTGSAVFCTRTPKRTGSSGSAVGPRRCDHGPYRAGNLKASNGKIEWPSNTHDEI